MIENSQQIHNESNEWSKLDWFLTATIKKGYQQGGMYPWRNFTVLEDLNHLNKLAWVTY